MSADTPDVLTAGEAYYRERGWSGCAGSAWDRLPPATQDGWNAAAAERERADAAERPCPVATMPGHPCHVDSAGCPSRPTCAAMMGEEP